MCHAVINNLKKRLNVVLQQRGRHIIILENCHFSVKGYRVEHFN